MKQTHADVRSRMQKGELGKDTHISIVWLWSDGLEVKMIKDNSAFNNVQVLTNCVALEKNSTTQNTLLFALTFKKTNHHDIFCTFYGRYSEVK